jgi:dTMP kinase
MKKGRFIVFEGGEGTGKSTVCHKLADELRELGHRVVVTREPGGTLLAERVRALLVQPSSEAEDWCPSAEFLLFAASRAQHIEEVIQPALKDGVWVVCDRFSDSSLVYQGMVKGAPLDLIGYVHRILLRRARPDLTFVMELDPQLGLRRTKKRTGGEDRFERNGLEFHKKIQRAYRQILKRRDQRRVPINAALPAEEVSKGIWTIVRQTFKV